VLTPDLGGHCVAGHPCCICAHLYDNTAAPNVRLAASPDIPGGCVVGLVRQAHHQTNRKLSEIMTRFALPRSHLAGTQITTRHHRLHRFSVDAPAARYDCRPNALSGRVRCDKEEGGNR